MPEERLPPQNLEAEQNLLGALLIDKAAVPKIVEKIQAEAFYQEAHRHIYQAVLDLFKRGAPIDELTVAEELKQKNLLEVTGGRLYLTDLTNSVASSAHAEYYAEIVEKNYVRRAIISTGSEMVSEAFENDGEPNEIIGEAQKHVFDLLQRNIRTGFEQIDKILGKVWSDIDANYGKPGISGLRTHFVDLDELIGGLKKSDMIVIAARPSMGKTAFALNVATNMAIKDNVPVAIFSLEMSKDSLVTRMLCSEAEIDMQKLDAKRLQEYELTKLGYAVNRLSQAPIFIDDTSGLSMVEIQAKSRRMKAEHNIQLIVIDYLGLIKSNQKRMENRNLEIAEIARTIKTLAKELAIPVVVISQLSRSIEKRGDPTPVMSDLRDSGEIEQVADLVMFVHRDDYYNRGSDMATNSAQIIVEKHRNGRTGRVDLVFRKEMTKFENISREEVPPVARP